MMSEIRLLLADNHKEYLASLAEALEEQKYKVFRADSPQRAKEILHSKSAPHLALLDIRLLDNNNPLDKSGLDLAKHEKRLIPKIILTNFPSIDDAVSVLRAETADLPYAVDFVSKHDGDLAIVQAVKRILSRYVHFSGENVFDLIKLKDLMVHSFNQDDLKDLCFQLSINCEDLEGQSRSAKIRELIIHFKHRQLVNVLIEYCCQQRPFLPWSYVDKRRQQPDQFCPMCGQPL